MRNMWISSRCGLASLVLGSLVNTGAWAASPATDNASNSAYSAGFTTGTNGGSGFGAWNITAVNGGNFINGGSNDPTNSPAPLFDIWNENDTGTLNVDMTTATRPFTGALTPGQSFSFSDVLHYGNSNVGGGSYLGWSLQDASGNTLMDFHTGGGLNGYFLTDAVSSQKNYPLVSYNYDATDRFAFTLNDASGDYTLVTTGGVAGGTQTITGQISMATGGPAQFAVYDNNGGYSSDVQFNNLAIAAAPEPATFAMLSLGLTSLLRRRR